MAAGIPLSPTHPADPYAWAVQEANRRYPRIANIPMSLTYNPQREGYSETLPPTGEDMLSARTPTPGRWNVEMGESPYYYTPSSWPELVALESLHALQATDPRYQKMTAQFGTTLTPWQLQQARELYARQQKTMGVSEPFQSYLPHVHIPEMIRGQLFRKLFDEMEKAEFGGHNYPNENRLTPEQQKLIDQIGQYMRTSG